MSCPYRQKVESVRRGVNALNIEVSEPECRCTAKPKPRHEGRVLAWIYSGGSPVDCCYKCVPGSEIDIEECC
jgi:hypothetical protein